MAAPSLTPTQADTDHLAAFIEAAEELEHEPFFGPDEKLSIRCAGERTEFIFGDRCQFRSALVSFRRIWLNDEASNFHRILKLLKRFEGENAFLQWFGEEHKRIVQSAIGSLSGKQLVDMWLNAVFAHTNLTNQSKHPDKVDRIKFDTQIKQWGHASFEYHFRKTVKSLGLCYLNLLRMFARHALDRWEKDYRLKPSFIIGAPFGRRIKEQTNEGAVIRQGSTEFTGNETLHQCLSRLMLRFEFTQLASVLKSIETLNCNLLFAIERASSYGDLLKNTGFSVELQEGLDLKPLYETFRLPDHPIQAILPHLDPWKNEQYITVIFKDRRIVTDSLTMEVLDRDYANLRGLLLSKMQAP